MNRELGPFYEAQRLTASPHIDPRGARHWDATSRHKLVCGRSVWILTMMRSCASAAKLRAAGPFSRSASGARFEYGFPPPRIGHSAVVLKNPARASNSTEYYVVPGSPFRTLDVRRRPPVVRQY